MKPINQILIIVLIGFLLAINCSPLAAAKKSQRADGNGGEISDQDKDISGNSQNEPNNNLASTQNESNSSEQDPEVDANLTTEVVKPKFNSKQQQQQGDGETSTSSSGGKTKSAPLLSRASANQKGDLSNILDPTQLVTTVVGAAPSAIAKETSKNVDLFGRKNLFGLDFGLADWARFIYDPLELIKAITNHFNLPLDRFLDVLGRPFYSGLEASLQPMMNSIRIIERVFVPDMCRLRFICKLGSYLQIIRERLLRFSPNFLDSSSQLKAFSEGMVGKNCETIFPNCEPKLRKQFEDLRFLPSEPSISRFLSAFS